jgi:two-component system sensor histidine kinase/response regulator
LGMLTLLMAYFKIKRQQKQLIAQHDLINGQKVELEKLNTVKDKMFSVISHDLRSPIHSLKVFFAISEHENISEEKRVKYRKQIEQSVLQTSNLMDNLLIWAQMQLQNNKPQLTPIDISEVLQNAVADVQGQANLKEIKIIYPKQSIPITSNTHILEIAVRNILSNAIKFSAMGQSICINSKSMSDFCLIAIEDKGIEISAEQIQQISEQKMATTIGTSGEKGTGMGLALTMQLLEKIKVSLHIQSTVGVGSIFTLQVPLG